MARKEGKVSPESGVRIQKRKKTEGGDMIDRFQREMTACGANPKQGSIRNQGRKTTFVAIRVALSPD